MITATRALIIQQARDADLVQIKNLYDEVIEQPGVRIDWQYPTPVGILRDAVSVGQLYFLPHDGEALAALKISEEGNDRIWTPGQREEASLYLGRVATSPREKGLFRSVVMPQVVGRAVMGGKQFIRLDCLADNQKLIDYYQSLGFEIVGVSKDRTGAKTLVKNQKPINNSSI